MFLKTGNNPAAALPDEELNMSNKSAPAPPQVPDGLLKKCNHCKAAIIAEEARSAAYTCPKCQGYFRMTAMSRIEMLCDEGSFTEWDRQLSSTNPLGYGGYEEKLAQLKEKTGLDEAIVTGTAKIDGYEAVIGVCDGRFMMASMGQAVGEKIVRAIERATVAGLPVILFACSGGARMQEGIVSLMQMAKTAAACKRHSDAGQLYISVLTDPTTGGVTASFAMLGDIILAEPGALIGFAGPRVIEQTIGQKLPKGFQRAEFLLDRGFIDRIVPRGEMKEALAQILMLHDVKTAGWVRREDGKPARTGNLTTQTDHPDHDGNLPQIDHSAKTGNLAPSGYQKKFDPKSPLRPWERVLKSRLADRPVGGDYLAALFDGFVELHGDRYFKDDPAVIGGIALFEDRPITVIVQAKGRDTKENVRCNFGMPSPEGYRKARRLMKQAEKFGRPVICLVDTPGAFCGIEAEERGQGEAIAQNLFAMSGLRVPILSVIIGEGGSGGALALAVADEVWMLENSIYSILSPEGFASIIWKDSKRAEEAADIMRLTAQDLKDLGIVEKVFMEPGHLTAKNFALLCRRLRSSLRNFLVTTGRLEAQERIDKRYQRFRQM